MEMIKDEISFIAKTYADRPHFSLQVADENFGILKRDLEISKHIKMVSDEIDDKIDYKIVLNILPLIENIQDTIKK